MGQVSILEVVMAMDCKSIKDVKSLKIERVFETSRLAGELMACAYENLVPISRKSINSVPQWKSPDRLWGQIGKEKRQCMTKIGR
jgi:hypothetical protein